MNTVGQILATILWLYWLVLIGRLIFDFITIFARNWRPRGGDLHDHRSTDQGDP
jgi:YggT family protein